MKAFFTILLLITSMSLSATELRFGGWSKHIGSDVEYNETHNAFLLEHKNYMVGYFKNSFNSDTVAVAMYKRWSLAEDIEVGVTGGLMYGYRDCLAFNKRAQSKSQTRNVCPMIYPEMRFNTTLRPGFGLLGNAFVLTFGVEL